VTKKPKVRDDLTVVVLDGEAVIYDDETGDLHHLNTTATIVFQLCDGSGTVPELASDIAEVFAFDGAEMQRQVEALVEGFEDAGLLAGVERKRPEESVDT
jgi:PqqD family protein of HPr-rel-A system